MNVAAIWPHGLGEARVPAVVVHLRHQRARGVDAEQCQRCSRHVAHG